MLPIKLVRQMAPNNTTTQAIASGLSSIKPILLEDLYPTSIGRVPHTYPILQTNDNIAYKYLELHTTRKRIEKDATQVHWTYEEQLKDIYPMGERWIEKEWTICYKNPRNRNK